MSDDVARRVRTYVLFAPVLVGAALRLLVWSRVRAPSEIWLGDARSYLGIAEQLLRGHLNADAYVWGPGYPLLGALLSGFAGPGTGLVLVSLLFGAGLPGIVIVAARAAGAPVAGFFAGMVVATYPDLVLAGARPLSEAAALTLLAACGICAEIARRTGRARWACAAGLVGGIGILTRAEFVVALVALVVLVGLARRSRGALLLGLVGCASVLVVPYLISYRNATGQWGLSLKPHMNVIRTQIHTSAATTLEARDQWESLVIRELTEDGELAVERLADAVSPSRYLLRAETILTWFYHVRLAASRSTWWEKAIWIAGLLGLAVAGREGGKARRVAVLLGLPYLATPLFLPYLGRHMLVAVPPLAWGTGSLLALAAARVANTRVFHGVVVGSGVVIGAALGHVALQVSEELPWEAMAFETQRAVQRGDLHMARQLATHGATTRPHDARMHDLLAFVLSESGNPARAEESLRTAVRLGGAPDNFVLFLTRAERWDEAEELLEARRLELDPSSYWSLAANVAFEAQRWPEAAERLARVDELLGPSQAVSYRLGVALVHAGRAEEAVAHLTRASEGQDRGLGMQAATLLKEVRRAGAEGS